MNIYLIRHGRQSSSDCNVNVDLAPEGERQAALLGQRMKLYPVDIVYCSDLIRAEQTAKIAFSGQEKLLDNLQIRPALAEVDFGELTGQPDAIVKRFYADYYQEQLDRFAEGRVQKSNALDEVPIIREWIESEYQNIAVVTHGGVIRILLTALFGGDFAKRLMFGTSLENCSITQLHYDEDQNGFYLDRFNDYAHLEQDPSLLRNHFK